MAKIRIIFDKIGNTLDIWFDDPKKEVMCEETGDEVILKKDKQGKVIGVEILNLSLRSTEAIRVPLELVTTT